MKHVFKASVTDRQGRELNRRQFLTVSGAAATFAILNPQFANGAAADGKLNIGLIGCGGRGTWILKFFKEHGGYNIAAVSDYFQDRVDNAGEKYGVPAGMRFTGLNGHKRLLDQKLDAVIIITPPYFHPEQAADAVAAGKHVYLAKPLAVDVPGCQSIGRSGELAASKNQAFLVDFQSRAHPSYQQAVSMVHQGKIGKIVSAEAAYQTGPVGKGVDDARRADPANAELRLRAWVTDRVLSGDIITEQNIHALDMASWALNAEPIKAYGAGGRKRPFVGDCWDHFACVFYYPDDVLLSFNSKQVGRYWDDIMCRVFGTDGALDLHYAGDVQVKCDDKYNGGKPSNLYADGAVRNIATFHESILKGDFSNSTVAPSVRSNLVTILGRTAAYKNGEVTWAEIMKANEKLEFATKGLKG
ncbi:MAG: Gfo/Idh/MocA family oxidoreductase [Verrucomicrobiota bacterium]